MNPVTQANLQSQPSASTDWQAAMQRIMALTAGQGTGFTNQPRANRFDAILEAVVPSRQNPTHEKVLAIVNALIANRAIRADEGGQMYNALLQRVSRYNSTNVQTNLDRLVVDVKEAVAQRERLSRANLGSLTSLNAFMSTLPASVERGQENYVAFLSALRVMVAEAPQSEVYQSGPSFYFQTSRSGSQTVNLTSAFQNLQPLWGVRAPVGQRSSVASMLTPNTRLLLLLIAPFTDASSISRDSYLGYLLTLYREALGNTRANEETFNEITAVSQALGEENGENLQATLNYLLTNRQYRIPQEYSLSENEERILRYVQQAVSLYLMQDGATPSSALDMTSANFEPSFYANNRMFINRLMDYFHRAAAIAPNYFTNAVLNPRWLPPEGFFTGEFDFPDQDDRFLWDDVGSVLTPLKSLPASRRPSLGSLPALSRTPSLSDLGAAAPALPSLNAELDYERLIEETLQPVRDKNRPPPNNGLDSLVDKMSGWKTYKQQQDEARLGAIPKRRPARPKKESQDDDDSSLGGTGNPFSHLRPRGFRSTL
nr:pIIIa protein [Lemur mastadenovirus]WGN96527.1 pIIIa protein [Lemur mastadenovirus]